MPPVPRLGRPVQNCVLHVYNHERRRLGIECVEQVIAVASGEHPIDNLLADVDVMHRPAHTKK